MAVRVTVHAVSAKDRAPAHSSEGCHADHAWATSTGESRSLNKPDEGQRHDGVRDGAFDIVVEGYDAVYASAASSPAFARLWAEHAYGGAFPVEFAHISFLTLDELQVMAQYLALGEGRVLVDLACGAGGPGLWIARQTGASLIGVDPSWAGLAQARRRSEQVGLAHRSLYQQGTFASTGLGGGVADGALSVDAIQYAPGKTDVFREAQRILRPGGRLAFSAFEVDPERVAGIPVLGVDPVADYAPLLETAGFAIDTYTESAGWADRVPAAYRAVIQAMPTLISEMGEAAAASLQMEAALTLQLQPYRRRVIVHARRLEIGPRP
jgi:ubiquinone/menaquinone biosynthesis C-methylase UbiE